MKMDERTKSKLLAELGSEGGKARAKKLSAKERRDIATKASKAAAKARKLRAGKVA